VISTGQCRSRHEARSPSVVVVYKWLPNYRVQFFEELRTRLSDAGINFRLIVGQPDRELAQRNDSASIVWAEVVTNRYLTVGDRHLVVQPCIRSLRSSDLVIVEQASKLLLNYLLLAWRPFGGPRVAFWGHGVNLDRRSASRAGEYIKRRCATLPDWWFCYTEGTARIVDELGVPEAKRTVVQNAVDTKALQQQRRSITDTEIERLRTELGMGPGPVAVSLGSIYDAKRPKYLIEAADAIRDELPDFELVVIGDGPDRDLFDDASATRRWMHPVGALTGVEMVRHAALGSIMLNPGLVGLGVLDAFALGLPVVTCDLPYHSPEIEYLVDGENGVILPRNTSPEGFARRVCGLLGEQQSLERLGQSAALAAESYNVEAMVDRFSSGVFRALGRPA
jgi:glycosyltransferase involved in cell wall biosynthesis